MFTPLYLDLSGLNAVAAAAPCVGTQTIIYPGNGSYPIVKLFCPRCADEITKPIYGVPGPIIYRCACGWDSTQPIAVTPPPATPPTEGA